MTPNLLIKGSTLLPPLIGDAHRADMRVRDGVITEIGTDPDCSREQVLDIKGRMVHLNLKHGVPCS